MDSLEAFTHSGPLCAALALGHQVTSTWSDPQSPNVLWPQDRTWLVSTGIDLDSTVVGGSERLVDHLLSVPGLEVWRGEPQDELGR